MDEEFDHSGRHVGCKHAFVVPECAWSHQEWRHGLCCWSVLNAIAAWTVCPGPMACPGVWVTAAPARNKANAAVLAAEAGQQRLRDARNEPRICQNDGQLRRMRTCGGET